MKICTAYIGILGGFFKPFHPVDVGQNRIGKLDAGVINIIPEPSGLVAHVGRCQRTVDVTKRIAFIRFPVSRQFRKAIFQGKSIAFTVYPNVT